MTHIQAHLTESAEIATRLARTPALVSAVELAARTVRKALAAGGTVYAAGSGGSAAEAQRLAAGIMGRFVERRRPPLPAVSLAADGAVLTAIATDYGYDKVFSRQITALAETPDVFVALCPNGWEPAIFEALNECQWRSIQSVLLTSELFKPPESGVWEDCCLVKVPTLDPVLAAQAHGIIVHAICTHVDAGFA